MYRKEIDGKAQQVVGGGNKRPGGERRIKAKTDSKSKGVTVPINDANTTTLNRQVKR